MDSSSVVTLELEVAMKASSIAAPMNVEKAARRLLAGLHDAGHPLRPGLVDFSSDDFLREHLFLLRICNPEDRPSGKAVHYSPGMHLRLKAYVYQLNEDGPTKDSAGGGEEGEGGGSTEMAAQYTQWQLPAKDLDGLWESLLYDGSIKRSLLAYAQSAFLFSNKGVDTNLISWNRVVLMHGPPGTGKTSLCKALAHKLATRLSARYCSPQLIEINAHSLFSRWFSESGKLVTRLFEHISELVDQDGSLVFLLVDEVESLAAARTAALKGSEPSDAVRVVNAVLTSIDALRSRPNVMLLTTSNISEAIDVAFLDRADLRVLVGPPGPQARYAILSSCMGELVRVGIALQEEEEEEGTEEEAHGAAGGAAAPAASTSSSGVSVKQSKAFQELFMPAAEAQALYQAAQAELQKGGAGSAAAAGTSALFSWLPVRGRQQQQQHHHHQRQHLFEGMSPSASSSITSAATGSEIEEEEQEEGRRASPGITALASNSRARCSALLYQAALACEGFSGRLLRKLPLQAHAHFILADSSLLGMEEEEGARASAGGGAAAAAAAAGPGVSSLEAFCRALVLAAGRERGSREELGVLSEGKEAGQKGS